MRLARARFDVVILAAIALLAHFLYLHFSAGDFFFPDSITYLTPAHNLLHGLGFSVEPGAPETFRTPGYPLFLVPFLAITMNVLPIVVVQHLLIVLLAIAVYFMARRLTESRPSAFVAGLVVAIDIPTIHHANKVLSETLFTGVLFALFVLTVWIGRRGGSMRLMAASGAIAGALVMIRPVAILYFIVLAAYLAFAEPMRRVLMFTLIAVLIPLGWGVRNWIETDVFTVSSVAGDNMLLHRAAPSIAIFGKHAFQDDLAAAQEQLMETAAREIVEEEEVESITDVDTPVVDQYYNSIGRRIALEHPLGLTLVIIRGIFVNLFESDWESIAIVSRVPATLVEEAINPVWIAIPLLAGVGVLALWRRNRALAALIAATIAYFVVISAGSEAEARFRIPVVPQLAIAAGAGVEAIRRGARAMSSEA